jgi:hypothetical protein
MDEKRASDSFPPGNPAQVFVPDSFRLAQKYNKQIVKAYPDKILRMAFLLRAKGLTYSKMMQN